MDKFYNIYSDLGDLSTDSSMPFANLNDALHAAAPKFVDYKHTIKISDDTTVDITDYQQRVEEIFIKNNQEEDLEQEHNRQLNSDYLSSRGC